MDIRAGIIASALLIVIGAFFSVRAGIRTIQFSRKMTFYRLRQARAASGWRMIGFGLLLLIFAAWLPFYGPPLAYQYFPPSPTPTLTPTITVTPSITVTPTMTETAIFTNTPPFTDTPTASSTPSLPLPILALFKSEITPLPDASFSPLQFSTVMSNSQCVDPKTVFQNPINYMAACYSYDKMEPGVQWTALWYRDGQMVHQETHPWNGGTGGFDFADCKEATGGWLAGTYEVQIFVGEDWKVVGQFIVQGDPPTATPTITASPTRSPTATQTPMLTPTLVPPLPSATAPQTQIITTGTP
jgi:hypothetical protein